MTGLTKDIHDRFKAFCSEYSISLREFETGWTFLCDDIERFEAAEREYGVGKTRRPTWGHKAFEAAVARVRELDRREREELNRLFGED